MFQAEALMPWRSALDNVIAGLEFRGVAARRGARAARASGCARVGLGGFGDRYPHQLSGGMRKRVGAGADADPRPRIMLMDEPFSALDIQTRQLMENEVLDAVGGEAQGGAVHHPRPRRGDRAVATAWSCCRPGPATHPIGEFAIDLPRPRDVAEIRMTPRFVELHEAIWHVLKRRGAEGLCAAASA